MNLAKVAKDILIVFLNESFFQFSNKSPVNKVKENTSIFLGNMLTTYHAFHSFAQR